MTREATQAARKAVALCSAAAVPYIGLKTYWACGGRAGFSGGFDMADEIEKNGAPAAFVWMERNGIDFTAVMALMGVLLAFALVRPWGRRIPRWLLFAPAWAGTLLIPYGLLTAVFGLIGENGEAAAGDMTSWVVPAGAGAFLGIGTALAVGIVSHRKQAVADPLAR